MKDLHYVSSGDVIHSTEVDVIHEADRRGCPLAASSVPNTAAQFNSIIDWLIAEVPGEFRLTPVAIRG